jgi:hypothetical protein
MLNSIRNGNPLLFGQRRGLEELGIVRQKLRKEWNISEDTLRRAGDVINKLLQHGDNRTKVAVIRTLVAVESMVPSDMRVASEYDASLALRDLQEKAVRQEAMIRALQGQGAMPSADHPTVVDEKRIDGH